MTENETSKEKQWPHSLDQELNELAKQENDFTALQLTEKNSQAQLFEKVCRTGNDEFTLYFSEPPHNCKLMVLK